jgi:hypothetical protein
MYLSTKHFKKQLLSQFQTLLKQKKKSTSNIFKNFLSKAATI